MQKCLKPRGACGIEPETFQEGVSFYHVLRPLDTKCDWLACSVVHHRLGRTGSLVGTNQQTGQLPRGYQAHCNQTITCIRSRSGHHGWIR